MKTTSIPQSVFDFLRQLEENNNRDWFNENKKNYQREHEHVIAFADELLNRMKEVDQITTVSGKKSLMRIYRDVRFSKDKRPYDPRFAGSFARIKPQLRGGYFFRFKPGDTVVGGGFYQPNADDLKLIREHIAQDDQPLRDVLENQRFKSVFGELMGEQLKTAPKGFEKDHPSIDLLRYKSMYTFKSFTDDEVHSKQFLEEVMNVFLAIRPFFDVMTEYLTTDLNGLSLID
ncbi:DUF2461 domain-containing protein [Roseivirga sp.]|uniref:DUF2461 domain-containing protein n=1 Tax=Roseivirga sp. TaxID=1964215 RepID=UPI003B521D29